MILTIAFLEGPGIRFPASKFSDPLVSSLKGPLETLSFPDFERISLYLHLPGRPNTFGPPGVSLRLNRKDAELVVRCVLDGEEYRNREGRQERLDAIVDGVIETIRAVYERFDGSSEELAMYEAELASLKNSV